MGLADEYVVMERGAVIASGQGKNMEADGVRKLVALGSSLAPCGVVSIFRVLKGVRCA